jgi:hypothetical protein
VKFAYVAAENARGEFKVSALTRFRVILDRLGSPGDDRVAPKRVKARVITSDLRS